MKRPVLPAGLPFRAAWLLALAPAALLAGCVNLAPGYARPRAPVPEQWPDAGAVHHASAQAPALPTADWRPFFLDERLRRIVALALDNNRDLRVAALNIERARAQYGIARAPALPAVGVDGQASRSRTPASVSSSGQARLTQEYSVELGLASYELDLFGRVRNLGQSALENYFAAQEARRSAQISLVAQVASAWLQLAADQQRLRLAGDTLASQEKSYDLIRRSHSLGAQSGLALAQAQTTVDNARAEAAAYESQVRQDLNALRLLVGATPPADMLPDPAAPREDAPAARLVEPPAGLPSTILQQRPDVLAAEHALRASHADIGAARAAFYPRIALTGAAGTASSTLSGLFESGSGAWSFGPSISLPIFDGGANRANLRAAEVQRRIQLANYEKTLQTAFREVADALAVRATLARRLQAQESLLRAAARSFELSQALFNNGGGSGYLEVLDAQRSLYAARQSLIDLRLQEQANRLELFKALGGGWASGQDRDGQDDQGGPAGTGNG